MQLQANFSEVEVQRPRNIETTTLGAAYLAGMGLGLWDQSKLKSIWKKDKAFRPEKKSVKYCRQKVKIWRHLAARSEMVFGLLD
jgi:glycerol kinase